LSDLPEPDFQAIGHETERGIRLFPRNLGDVMPKLLVGFPRIARAAFCLDDRQYIAARVVQNVVGYPVPRLRVVAINGHLETDLRPVMEIPRRLPQDGVDQDVTRLSFIQRISVAWLFHDGATILPVLLDSAIRTHAQQSRWMQRRMRCMSPRQRIRRKQQQKGASRPHALELR